MSTVSFIPAALAQSSTQKQAQLPEMRTCSACDTRLVFAWQGSAIRAWCDRCEASPIGRPFWPRAEFSEFELEALPEWIDPTGPGVRQIGLFGK